MVLEPRRLGHFTNFETVVSTKAPAAMRWFPEFA